VCPYIASKLMTTDAIQRLLRQELSRNLFAANQVYWTSLRRMDQYSDGSNLYEYVQSRPDNGIDPQGLITGMTWICKEIPWGPDGKHKDCKCIGLFTCVYSCWAWRTTCQASYNLWTMNDPGCLISNKTASSDANKAWPCRCWYCFSACSKWRNCVAKRVGIP